MRLLARLLQIPFLLLAGLCVTQAQVAANNTPLGKGVFLVATDQLRGTSFAKTVILITRIDAHGAMGLAINRRSQRALREFFPDLTNDAGAAELFLGGPVQSN